MNSFKRILPLLMLLFTTNSYSDPTYGFLTRTIETERSIEMSQISYLTDWQEYISGTGGITFTFPADLFTTTPVVQVSIKQNIPHLPTETYVAELVETSPTSATVMVYQVSLGGIVNEAPTGSVIVCLFALDNPTT